MKRIWAMVATASALVIAGCGEKLYEARLEKTLARMKYQQKIDSYLQPPAQGNFEKMNVFLRPPKPMEEGKLLLSEQPGMYDLTATFTGAPNVATPEPDPTTGQVPEAAVLPPMRLHVLGRVKPKKGAAKKGEPAPEVNPNAGNRGSFVADVRALLANDLGPEADPEKSPTNDQKKNTAFRRLIFQAQSGNTIQVYFAEANKGEIEVALVFDIPPALIKTSIVNPGVELCLDSFAIGDAARRMFNNGGREVESTEVDVNEEVF